MSEVIAKPFAKKAPRAELLGDPAQNAVCEFLEVRDGFRISFLVDPFCLSVMPGEFFAMSNLHCIPKACLGLRSSLETQASVFKARSGIWKNFWWWQHCFSRRPVLPSKRAADCDASLCLPLGC